MKLFITARTGRKETRVEKIDAAHYVVHVTARPVAGKANVAVIEALAQYLDIAPSRVRLMKGHHHKEKTVEVMRTTR